LGKGGWTSAGERRKLTSTIVCLHNVANVDSDGDSKMIVEGATATTAAGGPRPLSRVRARNRLIEEQRRLNGIASSRYRFARNSYHGRSGFAFCIALRKAIPACSRRPQPPFELRDLTDDSVVAILDAGLDEKSRSDRTLRSETAVLLGSNEQETADA